MRPRKNKLGIEPIYDESLKIAVARDYLTGNLSYLQVAEKYQLKNAGVVRWFVKWYKVHWDEELSVSNTSPPPQSQPVDVKVLRQELANANLKIAALEIMIEIPQKDLGIEIRKKPGTKQ